MLRPELILCLWTDEGLKTEFVPQVFGIDVKSAVTVILGLESTKLSVRGGLLIKASVALFPHFLFYKHSLLCSSQPTVVLVPCTFFVLKGYSLGINIFLM